MTDTMILLSSVAATNSVNIITQQASNLETLDRNQEQTGASSLFQITQLNKSLYLCGACALRADTFSKLRISCVINCTTRKELPDPPLPECVTQYHRIPIEDSPDTDLSEYFHIISKLIHQVEESGGVTLIHCVAGASRSASLCLAYLMKYQQMTLKQAYLYVKHLRPCIRPNDGFFSQLIQLEQELYENVSIRMIHDSFQQKYIPDVYQIQLPLKIKYCCLTNTCQKRNCGTH